MGLFNNLIKAVEDGTLEKRLANVADKVESISGAATTKAERVAKAGESSGKSIDAATIPLNQSSDGSAQ